jgi:hypothetical protein
MSTPSGKPFNPFDLSPYAPRRTRERSAPEQLENEGESAVLLSYAPRAAIRQAAAEEAADDFDDGDDRMAVAEDAEPDDADEQPEEESFGTHESISDAEFQRLESISDADLQRLESNLRWLQREGAAGRLPRAVQLPPVSGLRAVEPDPELRAVADPHPSYRAMEPNPGYPAMDPPHPGYRATNPDPGHRAMAPNPNYRAMNPDPARRPMNPDAGPRVPIAEGSRPRGEQFINGYRVPPSLAPERLRPPPPIRERRNSLRGPLRIVLASLLAAPVAYYFSVGGFSRWSEGDHELDPMSFESRVASPTTQQVAKDPMRLSETQGNIRANGQGNSQTNIATALPTPYAPGPLTTIAPNTMPSRAETLQPPGPPAAAAPRAVKTVRELDPEAIKLLVQQGQQFVAAGDIVTARLVFQRAAEAGDATAALAMGASYDPIALAKLGARGIAADVDKARSWYEKAKEFGSAEAPHRIELLAKR